MDEDQLEFELYVTAIFPTGQGQGTVKFTFQIVDGSLSIDFELPFQNAETIDAGVKLAAHHLAILAEALAVEARRLAE